MRTLLTVFISCFAFGLSNPMLCQSELKEMSSVSVEIVEVNNQGRVPGNTFRVYAVMPSPKYSVGVIFGNNQHVLKVETTGTFYHSWEGAFATVGGYDSYVTIGETRLIDEVVAHHASIDFDNFIAGGSLTMGIEGGDGIGGGQAVYLKDPNTRDRVFVEPYSVGKKANRVLLMQLTTDGTITGILNLSGRDDQGEGWVAYDLSFTTERTLGGETTWDTDSPQTQPSYAPPPESPKSKEPNGIRIRTTDKEVQIERVAVIGKHGELCGGTLDDGQGVAELVEGELLGIYDVVERRHLEEILNEQRLAMSGLIFEDSDFAKAGCLAGAQGTVIVSYSCLQDKTKLQVKLVDCSTSDLYWSATGIDVSEFELLDALRNKLLNR